MSQDNSETVVASAVIVSGDGPENFTASLSRLRRQTIASRMEVIILARKEHVEGIRALRPNEFADFVVAEGDLSTSNRGRVQGIELANGRVVIFAEDHSYPVDDNWAETLVEKVQGDVAGAGPVMGNANPNTAASWATLLIEYGAWMGNKTAGPIATIPGHNSAYSREVMLSYGDDLIKYMELEWLLQEDLRRKGYKLWLEPSIKVNHINYSNIGRSFPLHFLFGRVFADTRATSWSRPKRIFYGVAMPGIFAKRFFEIGTTCVSSNLGGEFMRSLPLLVPFLFANILGEAVGYIFGAKGLESDLAEMEYRRSGNLLESEAAIQRNPVENPT